MQVHYKTAHQSKCDKRDEEPEPVDALIQNRADDAKHRMQYRCKQKWNHQAGRQDGMSRVHRQHRSIEEANKERRKAGKRDRTEQALQMKLAEEGVARSYPLNEAARSKQVHRIPDAVIAEQTEEACGNYHRDPASQSATDAGGDTEGLDRQKLPMHLTCGRVLS